jgi:hypothetical protein
VSWVGVARGSDEVRVSLVLLSGVLGELSGFWMSGVRVVMGLAGCISMELARGRNLLKISRIAAAWVSWELWWLW